MEATLGLLQNARTELARAEPNKGGHRERALGMIDQAVEQASAGSASRAGSPSRQQQGRTMSGLFIYLRSVQRLDDPFGHLLGVAKQHHGVVAVEQRVVDAGIARG